MKPPEEIKKELVQQWLEDAEDLKRLAEMRKKPLNLMKIGKVFGVR